MLVGLVLGLAIYNAVLLDFPLPLALYRKLIGQSCTLRDLQDMEPTLGKSLTSLLQFEGQSAAVLYCLQSVLLNCISTAVCTSVCRCTAVVQRESVMVTCISTAVCMSACCCAALVQSMS